MRVPFVIAMLGLLFGAGCSDWPFEVVCTSELGIEIRPHEQTIRVGDGFDASVIGSSCGGRKQWKMVAEWVTTDTEIVRVDRASGRITGLNPGAAEVQAYSPGGGQPAWSSVRVTVVPR